MVVCVAGNFELLNAETDIASHTWLYRLLYDFDYVGRTGPWMDRTRSLAQGACIFQGSDHALLLDPSIARIGSAQVDHTYIRWGVIVSDHVVTSRLVLVIVAQILYGWQAPGYAFGGPC